MRKSLLFGVAIAMSLTCSAQFGGMMGGGFGGFGGSQASSTTAEYSEKFADINYVGDDQVYHTLDIYLPKEVKDSYPVVIHTYGSAWFSNNSKGAADINTICAALLKAGYAVVTPNHRSSSDAKYPAQINDIKAVIRFVRGNAKQYKFDTSFIATSGFSSGAHLAALAATTNGVKTYKLGNTEMDIEGNLGKFTDFSSKVNAFCEWSGPVDLMHMDCGNAMQMKPSPEEAVIGVPLEGNEDRYRLLSANTYIDKDDPAGYVFHGAQDNVVPVCQGESFYEALQKAGVESYFVKEATGGHGMNMYTEENLKKMVDFLNAQRAKVQK